MMDSPLMYLQATVAYADIFDFPLYKKELYLWCIKQGGLTKRALQRGRDIERKDNYYFLRGRRSLIGSRKKRLLASGAKWQIARFVASWLRGIPTIQLVGVTGGLAMNNADYQDDIDLFIITKNKTVWTSRLITTIIVDILGKRRKPGDTNVTNKICLNMFISENSLSIPKKEQDLFAAHEVLQMKPIWNKRGVYATFLEKNKWVKKFLPNAWERTRQMINDTRPIKNIQFNIGHFVLVVLEPLARFLQLWYMSKHRTTEVISDCVLRFHPQDARVWVKEKLRKRLDRLNIPLDKIFYAG